MTRNTNYFKMPFFLADTSLNLGERVLYAYLLNGSQIFPSNYKPQLSGMSNHLGVNKDTTRKLVNSLVSKGLVTIDESIYTVHNILEKEELFL